MSTSVTKTLTLAKASPLSFVLRCKSTCVSVSSFTAVAPPIVASATGVTRILTSWTWSDLLLPSFSVVTYFNWNVSSPA